MACQFHLNLLAGSKFIHAAFFVVVTIKDARGEEHVEAK